MSKRYFLGLDNGGTMTKAALLDMETKVFIAVAAGKTEMLMPAPDRTEKNFEVIWQANVDMIRRVVTDSKIDPKEIGGIAITGHGNGLYLSDANGHQAYNGIVSTDTRADTYAQACRTSGAFAKNLPLTTQSIWGGQPPMLLQWLKDYDPEALKRTRWIFLIKDMIRFRMTGEAYSEKTDFSGASLLNNQTAQFDDEILKNFGLLDLKDKIAPLKDSHDCCGYVLKEVAEVTGLAKGTPVFGGIMDINSCCVASGVVDATRSSLIGGTWSINQYISRTPVVDPGLFMDTLYCMPGWYLITEASPTGASNLEWFVSNILSESRESCRMRGISIYDRCEEMLADTKADAEVVFVPYLFSSHQIDTASACFLGLKSYHGIANMTRAVYEGVCFSHRYHMERLKAFGDTSEAIRISGGVAKSRVMLQMFADILGKPVETTYGDELGILGTLMSALVGSGACADYHDAVKQLVRVKDVVEPNTAVKDCYDEKFARYTKVVETQGLLV